MTTRSSGIPKHSAPDDSVVAGLALTRTNRSPIVGG